MKRKSAFEKKYPQFVKYITDENIQKNMLGNKDLQERCDNNLESINFLLQELDRHFDAGTVRDILIETVFKYPDELLKTFVSAYLNSDEATKSNPLVVSYFNKTTHLGTECLKYIEECGIIANRKYKELPIIAIDYTYKKMRKGNEYFKGENLDTLFFDLSYPAKQLAIKLVCSKSFYILDIIFENFNYTLNTILSILIDKHIDEKIITEDVLKILDNEQMMLYVCMLIDSDMNLLVIRHLEKLIINKRIVLIKQLVEKNLLNEIYRMTDEEIYGKSDNEILKELSGTIINLRKRDE